ncbi:hypothetical protein WJX73_005410 [Symbiochloris irregularis]|uniref:Uncharacterized protein n=1 Tax=Symbiochloris irregularis TaxID=706552 RepID=A0AAW1NWP1_9CHLO
MDHQLSQEELAALLEKCSVLGPPWTSDSQDQILHLFAAAQASSTDQTAELRTDLEQICTLLVQVCKIIASATSEHCAAALEEHGPGAQEAVQVLQAAFLILPEAAKPIFSSLSTADQQQPRQCLPDPAQVCHMASAFLQAAGIALLSERWLRLTGPAAFNQLSESMRGAIKLLIAPGMSAVAQHATAGQDTEALCQSFNGLLHIGAAAASNIAGTSQTPVPRELRSFAVLNCAWTALSGLLSAASPHLCSTPAMRAMAARALDILGTNAHIQAAAMSSQSTANQLKVCQFWVQHLTRMVGLFSPYKLGGDSWQKLLTSSMRSLAALYDLRPEASGGLTAEAASVAQRLAAALASALLCTSGDVVPEAQMQAALELLHQPAFVFIASCCARSSAGPSMQEAWDTCQRSLFTAALIAHPLQLSLLSDIWCDLLSVSAVGVTGSGFHNTALHQCGWTRKLERQPGPGDTVRQGSDREGADASQQQSPDQADLLFVSVLQSMQWLEQQLLGASKLAAPCFAAALHCTRLLWPHVQDTALRRDLLQFLCQQPGLVTLPEVASHACALAVLSPGCDYQPVQLFHALLLAEDWATQHEALEALCSYMLSSDSGDFRPVVPASLHDPGSDEDEQTPFLAAVRQHLDRQPPDIAPESLHTALQALQSMQASLPNHMEPAEVVSKLQGRAGGPPLLDSLYDIHKLAGELIGRMGGPTALA